MKFQVALAVASAALILGLGHAAHADQCALVDSDTAVRALSVLHDHQTVLTYCEPCGDRAPGAQTHATRVATSRDRAGSFEIVIDRREVDLAYTFVQTGRERFDNLAHLAGCPTSGVSEWIPVHSDAPPLEPAVLPPPTHGPVTTTTYVVQSTREVSFWLLLATCTATSAACTLGLFLILRRRRLAMRPRAIRLIDSKEA